MPEAIREITSLLHQRHRLGPGEADDFTLRDMTEVSRVLASTMTIMTNLLLCVALISLAVGGVGIMNIMLVSVTERTREIGIRLAVGARKRDIQRQFLLEAVLLSLVGGLVGIAAGLAASRAVAVQLHWPALTPVSAIVGAFLFSAVIGVFFGYYPAKKAAQLDPIEALRYE
jgi:ABC-type antimicrobial peptide transport system permease subunit